MPEEHHEEAEKAIEINLGGNEDSVPPTDPKAQRLRSWANIIATSTALLTAAIAVIKPQDQTVNKATYEQLKTSIEQTNEAVRQNREDMTALHNYLQGYFAGSPTFAPPAFSSTTPTASPPPPPPPKKLTQATPTATTTITFNTVPTSMATVLAYAPAAPAPAFPLPPVSSAAPPPSPPSFDSVAAAKK
jgi:hypothetical protein